MVVRQEDSPSEWCLKIYFKKKNLLKILDCLLANTFLTSFSLTPNIHHAIFFLSFFSFWWSPIDQYYIISAVRAFSPDCFWYSAPVPKSRHIRTRPKGDDFWPRVWTEAIKLLFYLGSNVNRSHSIKNLELLQQQWSPGDAIVFCRNGWPIARRHTSHHYAHMLQQPKVPM